MTAHESERHPAIVMPAPRHLQAGAIWVEVRNWSQACRRRYGGVHVVGSDGLMSDDEVLRATGLHGKSATTSPSRLRTLAGTFAKDARSALRSAQQARMARRLDLPPVGPWVWQHHDLFQHAGSVLAKRHGVPLVQFVDAPIVWEASTWGTRRPGWGRPLELIAEVPQLKRADLILCVSDEVADQVVRLGMSRDRILVTPCTADPAEYDGETGRRSELGIDENDVVVGWIGSFRAFHHLDVLVDAVKIVRQESPSVRLLLVGDGPDRERIMQHAEQQGVPLIAPGAVTRDEIPSYLLSIDVTVLPAGRDQEFHYSPLKLKEYLAAGRPTVAPRLGEMSKSLRDGHDALLYEPGEPADLARNIARLVESPGLRNAVGTAGRETCATKYSIDRQLEQIEDRLSDLGSTSGR